MENQVRQYPLFSACGLNCGLCPRYHTPGRSKCPGCAGAGFSAVHPSCGVLSCCRRMGIEYCFLCEEYPCKKYGGAGLTDSFITHKNQMNDLEKAKCIGLNSYRAELDKKVLLLRDLLENFNDGRRKGFFCLAVNLLDLRDVKTVLKQLKKEIPPDLALKEKSAAAVRLFELTAETQGISLKLRKK